MGWHPDNNGWEGEREEEELTNDHLPSVKLHDSPTNPGTPHHLPLELAELIERERQEFHLEDLM